MSFDISSDFQGVFEGRQKIMVLAPHPDDESLACGTLLSRAFADAGAHVICLTDGSASHPGSLLWRPWRLAQQREAEMIQAIANLGGGPDDLTWLGLEDARLYQVDPVEVAADLAARISDFGARHIFAPAPEDHHEDHQMTARIAAEIRNLHPEWDYYSYPVWSRWDDPDFDQTVSRYDPVFLVAKDLGERKRAAINAHQSQLGRVVLDDPDGFVLPPDFVEKFITEDEVFWRMS
ncbi:MAG: PIG-L deacetylase family protein [Sulfitobacter sp.]